MTAIHVIEGVPFAIAPDQREYLRQGIAWVGDRLRPRSPILNEQNGQLIVRGIIGTVAFGPGLTLEISPKTEPTDNWVEAVLDLLSREDRIEVAGVRRAGLAAHRNLLDVLAAIYAERLRLALRRDGPILILERRADTRPLLKGRLHVSRWARMPPWQRHMFPVSFQELTADNEFTRALAHVAKLFAASATSARVRGTLLSCARELRPGAPLEARATLGASLQRLPPQWGAYEPAWDMALAVLTRRTLLGAVGTRYGVSIALEPWPLLERLLQRALDAIVVRAARHDGISMTNPGTRTVTLLTAEPGNDSAGRRVIPDGRLDAGGEVLATFEAKYARSTDMDGEWPPRDHVFQALATAAAHHSPLAVLVYPDRFDPVWWHVHGFHDRPSHLAAIGLGLFGYRRGAGDEERGERLLALINGPANCTPEREVVA